MPTAEQGAKSSEPPRRPEEFFQPTLFLPGSQVPLDMPGLLWPFILEQTWGEVKDVGSFNDSDGQ